DAQLEAFRWLLEELRVALFAQELRTPMPVSVKRLQKAWSAMLRECPVWLIPDGTPGWRRCCSYVQTHRSWVQSSNDCSNFNPILCASARPLRILGGGRHRPYSRTGQESRRIWPAGHGLDGPVQPV